MRIETRRLLLRDLVETDRPAFLAYQTEPRFRDLAGLGEEEGRRAAAALFDRILAWQAERPRLNLQLGVFDRGTTGALCGCAGLRRAGAPEGSAELGIELAAAHWGRHRLALEVVGALLGHGFGTLGLRRIQGTTASGNRRVERLARWFGAGIVARRDGPAWMAAQGWHEVVWSLAREDWARAGGRGAAG